jgi:hypothetical protein
LVAIVKKAQGLEWILAREAAMEYILPNSWYRPHWRESITDISR